MGFPTKNNHWETMNFFGKFFALACVGVGIWDTAMSQDSAATGESTQVPEHATQRLPRYVNVSGKIEVRATEGTKILAEDVTLDDGSVLTPAGLITRKNGEEILLGELDSVGANGMLIPAGAGMDYIGPKYGRMWRVIDGRAVPMIKDTGLPSGSTVTTGGEVIAKDKTRAKLPEGQVIGMDGKIAAGVIDVDQVAKRDGKIWITQGGETRRMVKQTTLDDETRVQPDGRVLRPDGSNSVLVEGSVILANGEFLEAPTRPETTTATR